MTYVFKCKQCDTTTEVQAPKGKKPFGWMWCGKCGVRTDHKLVKEEPPTLAVGFSLGRSPIQRP